MPREPLSERLADELDETRRDVDGAQHLVVPTDEEKRNGWTAEALTEYVAEREAGAALAVDPHSLQRRVASRPRAQNSKYDAHRWRG